MIKVLASIALVLLIVILVLLIVILILVLRAFVEIRWRAKKVGSMNKQMQKDLNDIFEGLKRDVNRSLGREMRSIAEEKLQASKRKNECADREAGEESSNGLKAIDKELMKEIDDVF